MTSSPVRYSATLPNYSFPNDLAKALSENLLSVSPTGETSVEHHWYAFACAGDTGLNAFGKSPVDAVEKLLELMRHYAQNPNWVDTCSIRKVRQLDDFGCGVACLAMVVGITYNEARAIFIGLGLDRQNIPGRSPFASTFSQLRQAIATSTTHTARMRKWTGWKQIQQHAILKVSSSNGGSNWHWVVAERHLTYGIVIHDPASAKPSFQIAPEGVVGIDFQRYEPTGNWLEIS